MKTRNFTVEEIVHRWEDFPKHLIPIAYVALGYTQALRDAAQEQFKKEIPFSVNSGYRSSSYNHSIGGAVNSFHIWRFDPKGYPVFALDLKTDALPVETFYDFLKDKVRGETYIHQKWGFVHIAPYGPDEEWIK